MSTTATDLHAKIANLTAKLLADIDELTGRMVAAVVDELAAFVQDVSPDKPVILSKGPTIVATDPIDIPCPTCRAMPGSTCDPRGGSYETTGRGLVHATRAMHARTNGVEKHPIVAGREPVWCGVHQCWDDDCTKPRPVEVATAVNPAGPPESTWQDDDPLDEHDAGLGIWVTGDRTLNGLAELATDLEKVASVPVPALALAEPLVEQPEPTGNDGGLK